MHFIGYASDYQYGNVYQIHIDRNSGFIFDQWNNDPNTLVGTITLGKFSVLGHQYPLCDRTTVHKVVPVVWLLGSLKLITRPGKTTSPGTTVGTRPGTTRPAKTNNFHTTTIT